MKHRSCSFALVYCSSYFHYFEHIIKYAHIKKALSHLLLLKLMYFAHFIIFFVD